MASDSSSGNNWSCSFKQVLQKELEHVGDKVDKPAADVIAHAHQKQLVGLAFSGGGIRSATFNLGVLQALAQMKLLSTFDYLSAVSGGSYIASWLMAWMKRRRNPKDVEKSLRPHWVKQPGQKEPAEIHFLRQFSNYLTPKLGWLGADMWTVVATYLRNLILNLTVLIAAMTVLLVIPRVAATGARNAWFHGHYGWWALTAILAVFLAIIVMTRSLRFFRQRALDQRKPTTSLADFEDRDATKLPASGWKTPDGIAITQPSIHEALTKSDLWYDEEFDDFILKAKFSVSENGKTAIAFWQPRPAASSKPSSKPKPENEPEHLIHICGAFVKEPAAGTINNDAPVRRAQLRSVDNELEITCVKDVITVRINHETLNTQRVARSEKSNSPRFGCKRWKPGVIKLKQGEGVGLTDLRVIKLPSTLDEGGTQDQIQKFIVAPLFLAAFIATYLFNFGDVSPHQMPGVQSMRSTINPEAVPIDLWSWKFCALVAGTAAAGLVLVARLVMYAVQLIESRFSDRKFPLRSILWDVATVGASNLVGGVGIWGLYHLFRGKTLWEVMTFGTPALIGLTMLVLTLQIGLLGREWPDPVREWLSRLGAWLLIYSLVWLAVFGVAFYVSIFFYYVNNLGLSLAWVASTAWGVFAAKSAATGNNKSNKIRDLVAQIAPYVFVIGLFLFLSLGIDLLIPAIARPGLEFGGTQAENISVFMARHWRIMDVSNTWFALGVVGLGAIGILALFSWRLDINQFSLHLLYRNRLGRCYLGASNRWRRAQPFTGFAADDDFNLWELDKDLVDDSGRMIAPYLIINAALNLVGGKELAWQQRKAASFVFTQKYCGYEFPELPPGYAETGKYAARPSPVSLATAMAISGAAASPNMGYHTSPASAFLMTVFNVRLGWWLGNTRQQKFWERSSPGNVLISLLRELFALTSDEGKYIYLSDGGHFENLGIYELVRRRCRFIVACDAEEDPSFGFNGLGNAIEKTRADLGISIEIDLEPIRHRDEQRHTEWHCAIGRIPYSAVDLRQPDGILVYIKSSLTGDEPTDVLRYAAENPEFPHQSTGDQWFDESQFESYRALGCHIAKEVFGAVDAPEKLSLLTKEQLFVQLSQCWYPPSAATEAAFTKLSAALISIYDELRENKNLSFLSEQIYPEWRVLVAGTYDVWTRLRQGFGTVKSLRGALPRTSEELRAGFYICNSIFHVMENAYVDLDLEDEHDHPDNRGWMNLFRHWSWAPMCRVAWTISAGNYGARFQNFCERQLELTIGATEVGEIAINQKELEPTDWPPETERLSRMLANTICRWLLRGLPLDPEARSRAVAMAEKFSPGDECSEEDAIARTRDDIMKTLDRKLKERVLPEDPGAVKDAEWNEGATLLEIVRRGVSKEHQQQLCEKIVEAVIFHAATIAKRFSTDGVRDGLNGTERELIELFFIYNPELARSGRIKRFCLVPGGDASQRGQENRRADDLKFPVGFSLLASVKNAGGKQSEKLVYFRVQDHLRRIGVGRQAIEALIQQTPDGDELSAELYEMHPDAHEAPTGSDLVRFLTLFDSARAALAQKGILKRKLSSKD